MEDRGRRLAAPILSYEDLRKKANEFLAKYHPDHTIPVPIEEIVEFQLGIQIVPMPHLHELLDVDGLLTADLKEIYVHDFVYHKRPRRYRFTLAHEVGHFVLHADIYRQYQHRQPSKIEEWKNFVNDIAEKEHGWLEYQGYAFGGLVLVPGDELVREAEQCIDLVKSEGFDLAEHWDYAWTQIAASLAGRFGVSTQVIEKRLQKDRIPDQFA